MNAVSASRKCRFCGCSAIGGHEYACVVEAATRAIEQELPYGWPPELFYAVRESCAIAFYRSANTDLKKGMYLCAHCRQLGYAFPALPEKCAECGTEHLYFVQAILNDLAGVRESIAEWPYCGSPPRTVAAEGSSEEKEFIRAACMMGFAKRYDELSEFERRMLYVCPNCFSCESHGREPAEKTCPHCKYGHLERADLFVKTLMSGEEEELEDDQNAP